MDDLANENKNNQNWIGKEKDKENGLGDHGVRKYVYETGRFTSIDPLWNNYYGWTPYQYSLNSPVRFIDGNGYVVYKQNFTDIENEGFDKTVTFLRALESSVINNILDLAFSDEFVIYITSLSKRRDEVKSSTPSNVGRTSTLEEDWADHPRASGLTLKSSNTSPESDVILESESLEMAAEAGNYNMFNVITNTLFDELNHATLLNDNDARQDHLDLLNQLKFEYYNFNYPENSREELFMREAIERLKAHLGL